MSLAGVIPALGERGYTFEFGLECQATRMYGGGASMSGDPAEGLPDDRCGRDQAQSSLTLR